MSDDDLKIMDFKYTVNDILEAILQTPTKS